MIRKLFLVVLVVIATVTAGYSATQFDFLLSQVRTSTTSLGGGQVYFYIPGTTTLKNVWLDIGQLTPAANPYTLDANGTAQIYGTGAYRVVIKDSAGVTKYDRSPIIVAGEDGTQQAIDATLGNATYVLPAGGIVTVSKTDATANTVTISPSVGGQTIQGDTSYTLFLQYETVTFALGGSTWYIK